MKIFLTSVLSLLLLVGCQDTKEEKNLKYGKNSLPDELLQEHLIAQTVDFYGFKLGMGVYKLEEALDKSGGTVFDPGFLNYYKYEAFNDNYTKENDLGAGSMFGGSAIQVNFNSHAEESSDYKPSLIQIHMCRGRVNSISALSFGPKQNIEQLKKQFYIDAKYGNIKIKNIFKSSLNGRYISHNHVYSPQYSLSYDGRSSEYSTSRSENFSTEVGCNYWWDNKQSKFVYYNI